MSYEESDAIRDEYFDDLYEQFKMHHEREFPYEVIGSFYAKHPDVVKAPLQNLSDSRVHFTNEYYTSSFIHAFIAVEVGIKSVILKPILYSLATNDGAGNILFRNTFKLKSLKDIDDFYYTVLSNMTNIDLKNSKRPSVQITIWEEWEKLQTSRNSILHQGIRVNKLVAENALDMASYVCETIIPTVLDRFSFHIENSLIQAGGLEYSAHKLKPTDG